MPDHLRARFPWLWAGLLAILCWLPALPGMAQAQAPSAPRLVGFTNVPKLAFDLAPNEAAWLREHPVLQAGVVPNDYVPFDLIGLNNDYEGISADYLDAIAEALGVEVRIQVFRTRDEAREALVQGSVDILPTMAGETMGRGMGLSMPYAPTRHVEATSRDRRINRAAEINVGYIVGHVAPEALARAYPQAKLIPYGSAFLGVAAMSSNKVDVFVDVGTSIAYLIDHYQLTNLRLSDFGEATPSAMHFAFRASDDVLRNMVDRILGALPQRVRADVKSRWSPNYESVDLQPHVTFTAAERQWMASNPVVRFLPRRDMMPFSFIDSAGRPAGLALQVMDKIASETGLSFEAVQDEADDPMMVPAMISGHTVPAGMSVSDPYFRDHWVIVGRGGEAPVPRAEDLAGKRIAFLPPNSLAERIRNQVPNVTLVPSDSIAATYEAVADRKADVTIGNIDTVNYIVQQFYQDRLAILGSVDDAPIDISFAVRTRDPELLSIINKTLESIPPEEMRRVRANGMFFSRPAADWASYVRWLYFFGAGLLVCLAVFAVWARSLRKEVGRRHAVEAELRDQLIFQRAMLEGIPHAIAVRDAQGRLTSCNVAFERLFQVSRLAVMGKTLPEFEGDKNNAAVFRTAHEQYMRLLLDGTPISEDLDFIIAGVPRRILHWAAPISLKAHGARVAFVTGAIDMTERHHLVELIESARSKAEAANRAKSNFLATMSHEIRTPMNAVMGILELLVREGRLTAQDRDSAELARSSARGLLGLIDDILDISKIEAGGLEVVPRPAQLRPILHEVANVFASLARQRGLQILVEIDDAVASWHAVDAPRFRQIVNNLVSNAIKYSDRGGVTIRLKHLGVERDMESIGLEVADTGIGIAPQDVQNLFKPFFQAEAAGPRTIGGTGLGLPIVQRLCMRMGGDISVVSERGVGTTIHVALRLMVLPAPALEAEAAQAPVETGAAGRVASRERYTILVADDHPANRLLLQRQLAFLGFRSASAEDGQAALALWQQQPFDAIISDCSMPVMDGYELTRAIRAIEREKKLPHCPVLGWTAHVQEYERRKAFDVGMDECLMKPVSVDALLEALLRHLPEEEQAALAPAPVPRPAASETQEVFDLDSLKDFSGGDARIEASFLEALLRTNTTDLEELEGLVRAGATREIASCAHKIKGAARIVRATRVERDCEALEAASQASDAPGIERAFAALTRSLGEFNDALASQLQVFASLAH